MVVWSGVVKYKPSTLFQNLCDLCIIVHVLLFLSQLMRALVRIRARSGEYRSLDQGGENACANTQITELPKIKRRLILNDTCMILDDS